MCDKTLTNVKKINLHGRRTKCLISGHRNRFVYDSFIIYLVIFPELFINVHHKREQNFRLIITNRNGNRTVKVNGETLIN